MIDGVARRRRVVAQRALDLVPWNPVPQLLAALESGARPATGHASAAACGAPGREERALSARTAPEQERGAGADREADQRGREQIVLLFPRVRRGVSAAIGAADARTRGR